MRTKQATGEIDMLQQSEAPRGIPADGVRGTVNGDGSQSPPPDIAGLLSQIDRHLQEGKSEKALDVIARVGMKSPWLANAAGVCQLRRGNTAVAVEVFRGLVLASGGIVLRDDVPVVFKTNYAAALLASDNLAGCLSVLARLCDDDHPAVRRLRAAIQHWKSGLTLWQKLQWHLGGHPPRPLAPDFPLGDLT
jgi:hypothetical protein